jgi:hypothetical protein
MTYLTNFTGNPSASVPAGMWNGLPVGMQVTGRRHDDAGVMAAIAAFENARPWLHSYAILATRYDKLAVVYRGAAVLRAVTIWLRHLSDTL